MHNAISRARTQQQRRIRSQVRESDAYSFFNLLTGPELLNKVESLLPQHRERRFPPTQTLSMFLAQALSADRSCQKAVDEAAVKRLGAGLAPGSTHTGAYCPCAHALAHADREYPDPIRGSGRFGRRHPRRGIGGRAVRLVDGTTLRMPDTPANQGAYPQPRNQLGTARALLEELALFSPTGHLQCQRTRTCAPGGIQFTQVRNRLLHLPTTTTHRTHQAAIRVRLAVFTNRAVS